MTPDTSFHKTTWDTQTERVTKIRDIQSGNRFRLTDKEGRVHNLLTAANVVFCSVCDKDVSQCVNPSHRKYDTHYITCSNEQGKALTDLDLVVMLGLTPLTESLVDEQKFLDTEVTVFSYKTFPKRYITYSGTTSTSSDDYNFYDNDSTFYE